MRLGHEVDGVLLRQAARLADQVRAGVRSSVDVGNVVASMRNDFHEGSIPTPDEARQWARLNIQTNTRRLSMALDEVYAVGYTLGHDYAHTAVARAMRARRKAVAPDPSSVITDWANWKPGLEAASNLVRPPGGLQQLLDRRDAIIAGLDATTVDRIGTALADGLATGASDLMIAADIEAITGDASRALSIATTEMCSAVSVATVENYGDLEVERVEWFALEGCELCEDNAGQGPILLGEEFSSGDTEPPAHTNCRCSLLPWIEDDSEQIRPEQEEGGGDETVAGEALDSTPTDLPEDVETPDTAGAEVATETSTDPFIEPLDNFDTAKFADIEKYPLEWQAGRAEAADLQDPYLKELWSQSGFDALPQIISESDWRELAAAPDATTFYRFLGTTYGQGAKYVEEFRSGKAYAGLGFMGNGTYFSSQREIARRFGVSWIEAVLDPSARGIKWDALRDAKMDLQNTMDSPEYKLLSKSKRDFLESVYLDPGRLATYLGYDYIDALDTNMSEIVVLNRAKVITYAS